MQRYAPLLKINLVIIGDLFGMDPNDEIGTVMSRRADQLMAEDNDEAIPYCVATGEIKKLVTFFRSRGQLLEALIIAQVPRTQTQTA